MQTKGLAGLKARRFAIGNALVVHPCYDGKYAQAAENRGDAGITWGRQRRRRGKLLGVCACGVQMRRELRDLRRDTGDHGEG